MFTWFCLSFELGLEDLIFRNSCVRPLAQGWEGEGPWRKSSWKRTVNWHKDTLKHLARGLESLSRWRSFCLSAFRSMYRYRLLRNLLCTFILLVRMFEELKRGMWRPGLLLTNSNCVQGGVCHAEFSAAYFLSKISWYTLVFASHFEGIV